jgi:hypothetical protein
VRPAVLVKPNNERRLSGCNLFVSLNILFADAASPQAVFPGPKFSSHQLGVRAVAYARRYESFLGFYFNGTGHTASALWLLILLKLILVDQEKR